MLADPRHSSIILLNMTRGDRRSGDEAALGQTASLALLTVAREIFGIRLFAVGDYERAALPRQVVASFEHLAGDTLSLWRYPSLEALAGSGLGIIFLGGTFLEEELLITALEGARQGYDIRLLSDLSLARQDADRSLVLNRLAHYGIFAVTVRQTLLEWAVALGDEAVSRRIQELLS
jgi:hypothetical protein